MGSNFSKADPEMEALALEEVKRLIADNEIVIFSKTYCPYCTTAKKIFEKLGKAFKVVELDQRNDGDVMQSIFLDMTGAKTVPRVFVKGTCIGGASDLTGLYESGKLQPMLQ